MVSVAIVGGSGYTGGELIRLLSAHPEVEIVDITSRQFEGTPVHKVHPHIRGTDLVFRNKKPSELDADIIFTATPHGASMKIVPDLLDTGAKVIDLSGDYRFNDIDVYEKWYGIEHTSDLKGVFGLPEIHREEIKKANRYHQAVRRGHRAGPVLPAPEGAEGSGEEILPALLPGSAHRCKQRI